MFRTTVNATLLAAIIKGEKRVDTVFNEAVDQIDQLIQSWSNQMPPYGMRIIHLVLGIRTICKEYAKDAPDYQNIHMAFLKHQDGWRLIFETLPESFYLHYEIESIFKMLRTAVQGCGMNFWVHEEGSEWPEEMRIKFLQEYAPAEVETEQGLTRPAYDIKFSTEIPGIVSGISGQGYFAVHPVVHADVTVQPISVPASEGNSIV